MKMQIDYSTYFFRFFTLVIFLCIELHHLVAFGADGEKFYGYWYLGRDFDIDVGNKDTREKYDNFRAENPSVEPYWWSEMKFAGYASNSSGHYLGGMLAVGGYREKANEGESVSIMIMRVYANYLVFLLSKNKGLFLELSGGPVMAGYERKDNGVLTNSRSDQEYGYGASFALGYEFKLVSWFSVNVQGSYNFAHSTALGNVTWKDYGAAVSVAF